MTAPPDIATIERLAHAANDEHASESVRLDYLRVTGPAYILALTAENKALRKLVAVIERAHPALVGKARYDIAAGAANER